MRIRWIRHVTFVSVLAAVAAMAAGCNEDILFDPNFRNWCGDDLCAWTTVEGRIRRAPTWHAKDQGVELMDAPTTLSQRNLVASPACVELTMIADVEPEAQVSLAVDYNLDGTFEHEEPIPAVRWREIRSIVTAPKDYSGFEFQIRKRGVGRAVLASIRARARTDCSGVARELQNLPLGARCSVTGSGAECHSGICCSGLCAECCPATVVDGGDAAAEVWSPLTLRACAEGVACERRNAIMRPDYSVFGGMNALPLQCGPGTGTRGAGEGCVADDDCASGACEGAIVHAFEDRDPSCALAPPGAAENTCMVASFLGGRCR